MRKILWKKLTRGGFTLAELLIVVAIIAVLVAIAVPMFTSSLENSRTAVHRSNARALKVMAITHVLQKMEVTNGTTSASAWKATGVYDFDSGKWLSISISEIKTTSSRMCMSLGELKEFGKDGDEKEIGKEGTTGKKTYVVEFVAEDAVVEYSKLTA